jgi:hypothetical protein
MRRNSTGCVSSRFSRLSTFGNGKQIILYRNGVKYADYTVGSAEQFSGDRLVLMGLRHSDANPDNWSGTMSLPRVLSLGPDGMLRIAPPDEIERLRYHAQNRTSLAVPADQELAIDGSLPLGNVDCLRGGTSMAPFVLSILIATAALDDTRAPTFAPVSPRSWFTTPGENVTLRLRLESGAAADPIAYRIVDYSGKPSAQGELRRIAPGQWDIALRPEQGCFEIELPNPRAASASEWFPCRSGKAIPTRFSQSTGRCHGWNETHPGGRS